MSEQHGNEPDPIMMLKSTGDYERFKELLRSRLYECGWVDQVHIIARQTSKNEHLNTNEVFDEVAKKGRGAVPASVKKELLSRVKEKLLQRNGYYR